MPFLNWFRRKPLSPLTGAPEVRRQKAYSAQSGYVYQYYYLGQREAQRDGEPGTQFVFDVSADRRTSFPVSVFVSAAALAAWQQAHGRDLIATEIYAIAKMSLFQAFDERDSPELMRTEVGVRTADVEAILATLGLD